MNKNEKSETLIFSIIEGIENVKGENIKILDLRKIDISVTDYFIFCNGKSNTQVSAIASSIQKNVFEKIKEKPWHVEGLENAQWVLLDYTSVVVHIFQKEIREYYDVEGLWSDAETIEISNNELKS